MTAVLATLAFLTAIWLVALIAAATLDESWDKIGAALRGRVDAAVPLQLAPRPVRLSQRLRPVRTLHAQPEWRAAA